MKINSIIIACITLLLTACGNNPQIIVCGTYTDTGSYGIYSLAFDPGSGEISVIDSIAAENPSYLAFSQSGNRIYAVGESGGNSCVYAMDFCPDTGQFSNITSTSEVGADPCYIATAGKYIVTADYSGGSVSFFTDSLGCLTHIRCDKFYGCGADSVRQASTHIHCTMKSPDGNDLFVSDLGCDKVYHYDLRNGISLTDTIDFPAGFGPRHIAFTPDGEHAYILGELSGDIMILDRTNNQRAFNTLTPRQSVVCDSLRVRASGDVHVSPDGKFLYASNRREGDGIRTYSIAPDGSLSSISYTNTSKHPRNFLITPSGDFLLVASRDDNRIEIFRRNHSTGILSPTEHTLPLPKPVCLIVSK